MESIIKDFRKFVMSEKKSCLSTLDSILARGGGYVSPNILEERQLNVTQMDVFSRLMMDRIIFFGTEVTSDTANIVVAQLLYLENANPDSPITMYINSPGGSVYDGYGIINTMDFIKPEVHTICTGMAASMGSMLLMCGEKGHRAALPLSRVMIHQPLGGAQGQASDIEITAREIGKVKEELYDIITKRTGQSLEKVVKDADRDCWLTSKEALDYGIIDYIVEKR